MTKEREKDLNHRRKGEKGLVKERTVVSRRRVIEREAAARENPAISRATCASIGSLVVRVSVAMHVLTVTSVRRTMTRRSTTATCTRTSRLVLSLRDPRGKEKAVGYVEIGKAPEHASTVMRVDTNMTTLQPLQRLLEVVSVKIRVGLQVTKQVRNPPPQHRALRRPVLELPPLDGR